MLVPHLGVASASFHEVDAADPLAHRVYRHDAHSPAASRVRHVRMPPAGAIYQTHIENGIPLVCRDAAEELDASMTGFLREWGVAGVISAPIVRDGRLCMILGIQSDTPRDWTQADVRLATDLAELAWTVLRRVRAEAALAEREANQAFLIDWSDAVRDETDPDRVIDETLKRLGESFEPFNVSFSELDRTGAMLETVRVWQAGRSFRDTRKLPVAVIGPDLVAELLGKGSVSVEDVFADARIPADCHTLYRDHGVGALLAAPIISRGRVMALLALQADRPRRWTAGERQVLRDLADRVWSTIERGRTEIALDRSRAELAQAEKMASLGAVLAGISHELNNPLAVVTAQAQLIAHLAQGTDLAARANRVYEAGDRCARIVRTFLAMARQTPPERRRTALDGIIRRALDQVAAADAGIAVTFETDGTLPDVLVDPNQIHQVLVNLLVNAQHALANQEGDAARVVVRAGGDGHGVAFVEVADNGPGVPEAVRTRIFEPFFTTKPAGQGTGMGLALAQGLAELHGGGLALQPSPTGRGATFRLTLPTAPAPPDQVPDE